MNPMMSVQYYGSPYFSVGNFEKYKIVVEPNAGTYSNRFIEVSPIPFQDEYKVDIGVITSYSIHYTKLYEINKQIAFMTNYELAFKPEATLFSYSPMSMNNREDIGQRLLAFQNEILAVPGVNSFAVSSSVPGKEISRTRNNFV